MTEEQPPKAASRFAALSWRTAAIAAGAASIGIVALAALGDAASPPSHYRVEDRTEAEDATRGDPLLAELARCRALPADTDDALCRAAWEVNRRRFLGESRSYVAPAEPRPLEPAPSGAPAPTDPASLSVFREY